MTEPTELEVFPRRNLGRSDYWGRIVEDRIANAEKTWGTTDQSVAGSERGSAAALGELSRRSDELREAVANLPVVRTAGVSNSGFAMGAGWNTLVSAVLPWDGRDECNVVAMGSVQLNAATGGFSTPSFIWPFSLSLVTSEYGPRSNAFHEGMDFAGGAASPGNPIPAAAAGTVQTASFSNGFGNYVILNHGNVGIFGRTAYTLYAHMATTPSVTAGQSVSQGQTLGVVGNTGHSFGAHLHYETHAVPSGGSIVWDNLNPSYASARTAVNPREFMDAYGTGSAAVDTDVVCRIVIEGSASTSFKPFKDQNFGSGLPCWFRPVYGRSFNSTNNVDVALQVWTTAGLPDNPFNKATLSVEAIFS